MNDFANFGGYVEHFLPKSTIGWGIAIVVIAFAVYLVCKGFQNSTPQYPATTYHTEIRHTTTEDLTAQWKIEHAEEREEALSLVRACDRCGKLTAARDLRNVEETILDFWPFNVWPLSHFHLTLRFYCASCLLLFNQNKVGKTRRENLKQVVETLKNEKATLTSVVENLKEDLARRTLDYDELKQQLRAPRQTTTVRRRKR